MGRLYWVAVYISTDTGARACLRCCRPSGHRMGRAGPLVRGEGSHDGCELCGKPRLCGGGHGEVQGCAAFTGSRDARGGQKADRRKRLARRQRGRVAARGERINRDWQYDGLSTPQKDAIDPGQHPSLWTAPALGLKMATRLRLLLDILNAPEAGIRSQWSFHETDHVLMSTAGAGGTTIATSLVFKNVSAGDFCPAQLLALRHNIHTVMRLDGVSVDQTPMNLMSRPDFSRYSAIVIEPLWGGLKFSEVVPAPPCVPRVPVCCWCCALNPSWTASIGVAKEPK